MHPATQHRSSLFLTTRVVLLAALAAATLTVAQRRLVGDRPTSVSVVPVANNSDCVKSCDEAFIKALQAECDTHRKVVRFVCGGNFVCHKDENFRHHAALQAILATRKACKNGCTPQGAGAVGS